MSDTANTTDPSGPAPVTPEPVDGSEDSIGTRIDAAIEALRTELSARIDTLQETVAQLSDKVDAAQGRNQ